MNLIATMMSVVNGGAGQQLTSQYGVDASQLGSVLTSLAPLLAGGLKDKLSSDGAGDPAGGLLDILKSPGLQQYADNPTAITSPAAASTGQNILSQLFGGSSMLSTLATTLSEKTGVGSGIIQQLLPVLTTLIMGLVAKQATSKDGQIDTGSLTNVIGSLSGEHHGFFDTLKTAAGKFLG